jgi:hypothetical protein
MFADESGYNVGRYRAVAVVSTSCASAQRLSDLLSMHLGRKGIAELKWQDVRTDHRRDSVLWAFRLVFIAALRGDLRVDVVGWDTFDSRHRVKKRDDIANLERMYYHLCRNVMRLRWPNKAIWQMNPDQHSALDWETIQTTLLYKSAETVGFNESRNLTIRQHYVIHDIVPRDSKTQPLIQVADIFAGLMVYSRSGASAYDCWRAWYKAGCPKRGETELLVPSASEKSRSELINKLGQWIRAKPTLGFALDRSKGLYTSEPAYPINFWWYRPQSPQDKAPTK